MVIIIKLIDNFFSSNRPHACLLFIKRFNVDTKSEHQKRETTHRLLNAGLRIHISFFTMPLWNNVVTNHKIHIIYYCHIFCADHIYIIALLLTTWPWIWNSWNVVFTFHIYLNRDISIWTKHRKIIDHSICHW